ncbi:hypothetical protein LBMAG42_35010 [Deltaproteobacteria bacterium]|nr:hypothetical protein LBMAG42_35010 [Deltaproteobacteria bacterium]
MTLVELADAADVTARTVRYYIQQGLLPPPVGGGATASYTDAHLRQLKAIKAFQLQHLPLSEIRSRLGQEPPAEPGPAAAAPSSALDYLDRVLGHKPSGGMPLAASIAPNAGSPLLVRSPPAPPYGASPPTSGGRSTWDRHQLVADVELHVRRPLPRDVQRKLDKLLDYARQLFEEAP